MNHQHAQALKGERLLALLQSSGTSDAHGVPDNIKLDGCGLDRLPGGLELWAAARTFSVYDNELTTLPEALWQFTS